MERVYHIFAITGLVASFALLSWAFAIAYPLELIHDSQGFGFLFKGLGGYYFTF